MLAQITREEYESIDDKSIVEIWLISSDYCPGCDLVKTVLASDIESGNITIVNTDDERAKQIMAKLGIDEVPALLYEMENGTFLRVL